MNRLGMIVDLSKSSIATMRHVIATSDAPVIFSHSSAFELCNSSRNVQDEILESVTKNGGLVMVNFYSKFLSCAENSTIFDAIGMYLIDLYLCLFNVALNAGIEQQIDRKKPIKYSFYVYVSF